MTTPLADSRVLQECQAPDCSNPLPLYSGQGRPQKYCSDLDCKLQRANDAEKKSRKNRGAFTQLRQNANKYFSKGL